MSFRKQIMEAQDLSKYHDTVAKWIDENDNMAVRILMAKLIGNKRLIEIVKAINNIIDYEKHNAIYDYSREIENRLHNLGRKKFGKDNWNKNIYNPS
jgi:hypothetical protein